MVEAGSVRFNLIGGLSGVGAPTLLGSHPEPRPVLPPIRSRASSNLLDYSGVEVHGILSM